MVGDVISREAGHTLVAVVVAGLVTERERDDDGAQPRIRVHQAARNTGPAEPAERPRSGMRATSLFTSKDFNYFRDGFFKRRRLYLLAFEFYSGLPFAQNKVALGIR